MTEGEPGYCCACGEYHLLTPTPEWAGNACQQCKTTRRLDPPEPGPRHICNTSDRHKPGHPEYRQCTCGQWYHSGGGYWYQVPHPPLRWLHEHGLTDSAESFWDPGPTKTGSIFGEFFTSRHPLRRLLLILLRRGQP